MHKSYIEKLKCTLLILGLCIIILINLKKSIWPTKLEKKY